MSLRRRTGPSLLLPALLLLVALLALPASASADRGFTPRFSANDTGDITFVANTLMTCPTSSLCSQARNGTASPIANLQNNAYAMTYVDVDSDSSTFDSSTAGLSLPAGSTVLFAGLYWGGDYSGNGSSAAPDSSRRNKVVFKAPGDSSYRNVTATTLDDSTISEGRYQAFADVTSIVAAAGDGTYAVGNVQAGRGEDKYAGWSLVIAYRDTTQPARNLTVFDGLKTIDGRGGATIPVSGFKTPPGGPVRTTLGFITYEGDLGIEGDSASLNGTPLTDAQNPQTNFFNSTVSDSGSRVTSKNPDYPNQLGIDADLFNADGVLANNATSANIQVTTSGDVYLPGVLTFATELFAPKIDQTKSVTDLNGGAVEEGDTLEYTISGTNSGQDGAVGFTARDPIPPNTTYVPGSLRVTAGAGAASGTRTDGSGDDNGEYDSAGNRVVARLGTGANASSGGRIAVGANYEVKFQVKVVSRLAQGTTIPNTATSSFFSESLNNPLTATSSAQSSVAAPDLAIVKSHDGAVTPGAGATYHLAVSNSGNAPIRGTQTTVTDTMPGSLTPTSVSGAGWSCAPISGPTITCGRADNLAAGASYPVIEIQADVASDASTPIENTATVANSADANPANDSSLDPAPTSPSSDLSISKSASPSSVAVGDQVSFTLQVANAGPSRARNVSVADSLPAGFDYVSATSSAGTCDSTISCSLGDLPKNGTASVTIVARATSAGAGTTIRNTASVTGEGPDPNHTNDSASADVTVAGADLAVTKTIADDHPSAGGPVSYTLVVRNDGPSAASSVVVRDALPSKLTGIGTDRSECAVSDNDVTCSFATLAPGATETIHVDATVAAGAAAGSLGNTASVSAAEADPDPSDNSSTAHADVGGSADISLTKTADAAAASTGDEVTYTLTALNHGPSSATGARIVDQLPAGVSFVSAGPGCSNSAGTVICALGTLGSGADAVRTVTVRIDAGAVGTLSNTADADSAIADPDPGNNHDSANTEIVSQADLSLSKSVSPGDAVPGDVVTYTLTVRNDGPIPAHDVTLADTVPGGVTFVDSSPTAPDCGFTSGSLSCELGTLASGATRTVTVRATVDPIALPADHEHLMPVEKTEQQIDLEAGETKDVSLTCPTAGEIMTDGTIRADAADQGTGTLASIVTSRARSSAPGTYEFEVTNTAGGRAQAKAFGVCIPSDTAVEQGHVHHVLVGDPVEVTAALDPGRHEVTVPCGAGAVAIAPGIDAAGGVARFVGSEPAGDGRRFTIEVTGDAATVELSVRCMAIRLDTTAGHTHDLRLDEVSRSVSVPANSTVSESVICADDAKGIVSSYELDPGLLLAGHDPEPKSRVYRLVNPTGAPISATLDLLCLGDRTSGPVAATRIVNSASTGSPTPDPDVDDRVASATLSVATIPPPDPPGGPVGGDPGSGATHVDGATARLKAGSGEVLVPVACADAACEGSLALRAADRHGAIRRGRKVGSAHFSLAAGERTRVSVLLTQRATRLARRGKLRRVDVVLRAADGAKSTRTVRLRRRHRHR